MATSRPAIPLAPIGPTHLLCLGCGNHMRREIDRFANGKLAKIIFYCDSCQYGFEPSMVHASGQNVKYVPKEEKSVAKSV